LNNECNLKMTQTINIFNQIHAFSSIPKDLIEIMASLKYFMKKNALAFVVVTSYKVPKILHTENIFQTYCF